MKQLRLNNGMYCKVDDEDYEELSKIDWSYNKSKHAHTGYCHARVNKIPTYMHRLIMKAPKGVKVDHKNHDGLDNQKDNLIICTHHQNMFNRRNEANETSKYHGVFKQKGRNRFRAAVLQKIGNTVIGRYYIGSFIEEIEAAKAYNRYLDLFKITDLPRNNV